MTNLDHFTWVDHFQGCVPPLPPLTENQRGRLLRLSQIHPERRSEGLSPRDEDYPVLNDYLSLNPEKLRQVLHGSTGGPVRLTGSPR